VCHLSFGDFEAETAAGINLVDVLAHGWDISPLQGRWFECGNETWSVAPRVLIGPNSRSAPLWTELVDGPDANSQERILAYLGRQ